MNALATRSQTHYIQFKYPLIIVTIILIVVTACSIWVLAHMRLRSLAKSYLVSSYGLYITGDFQLVSIGRGLSRSELEDSLMRLYAVGAPDHLRITNQSLDDNLLEIVGRMTYLRDLKIGGAFTDQGLIHLNGLQSLSHMAIRTAPGMISVDGLSNLLRQLPNLHTIDIHGSSLTTEEIELLRNKVPRLKVKMITELRSEPVSGIEHNRGSHRLPLQAIRVG